VIKKRQGKKSEVEEENGDRADDADEDVK